MKRNFNIPGKVQAKQRPRFNGKFAYTPKETIAYENWVRTCYLEKYRGQPILENPLKVKIIAYFEINKVLRQYEFYNTQGSVYLTEKTDMANLFRAIDALKRIPWFQASVRDLRAFRVEDWSNFTDFIKENK